MSLINSVIKSDFRLLAGDTNGEAESVVYLPHDGPPRTIRAFVERQTPDGRDGLRPRTVPIVMIVVENDRRRGIASKEIDMNADKVRVAQRPGGTPADLKVHYPEGQGSWVTPTEMTLELW